MKLSVKGLGLASMVVWGGVVFLIGLINHLQPGYGKAFLKLVSSVYPGYHALTGGRSVLIGTGYALIDGLVCGALFAWVYNFFAKEK